MPNSNYLGNCCSGNFSTKKSSILPCCDIDFITAIIRKSGAKLMVKPSLRGKAVVVEILVAAVECLQF